MGGTDVCLAFGILLRPTGDWTAVLQVPMEQLHFGSGDHGLGWSLLHLRAADIRLQAQKPILSTFVSQDQL